MKKPLGFLVFPILVSLGLVVHATTVIPPNFDELVSRAQVIFEGEVTGLQSQWIGEGAEHRIVTFVTFKVVDALKGNPGENYSIRMLGGTVDGRTMEVTDAPKFKVGDHDVLFVENNGRQFIPLVGIQHGHVLADKALGFEVSHAPRTGRGRQADPLGKLKGRDTTILLQNAKDLEIDRVQLFHGESLSKPRIF